MCAIARLSKPILIGFVLALTVGLIILIPWPLTSDLVHQLWIGEHLRQGARLYIDIAEINPPLWFWMAMPVDWLADVLRLPPDRVLIAVVGAVTLASLMLVDRLLDSIAAVRRLAFLLFAAAILLIMPVRDFGQREQLALILTLPYVALIAARLRKQAISWPLALLVGLGSAVGFALKHYFIAVPLLLELSLLIGLRREWRPIRTETLALLAAALAYGAAILIIYPAYLSITVPEVRLAYGALGAQSVLKILSQTQIVWLLLLLAIASQYRILRDGLAPFTISLVIAAAGFCVAWAIQHKGWPYQGIAVTGFMALAFAAVLAEAWDRVAILLRLLAVTLLALPLALALSPTHGVIRKAMDIGPALSDLRSGDVVAVVSAESRTVWPSTVDRGFRFASRYPQYWMLAAISANEDGPHEPLLEQYARKVVRQTVIDYRCFPPKRIVFVRPRISGPDARAVDDPLAFFLRSPDFAHLMSHYRHWQKGPMYDAFQLVTRPEPVPASECPRGL